MTVDLVLSALADPTRRDVLSTLARQGDATATTLATTIPVTRQALVKHLGVLDKAGLVSSSKHGREVRFRVETRVLDETSRWMADLAREWDVRLAALKRLAEMPPSDG